MAVCSGTELFTALERHRKIFGSARKSLTQSSPSTFVLSEVRWNRRVVRDDHAVLRVLLSAQRRLSGFELHLLVLLQVPENQLFCSVDLALLFSELFGVVFQSYLA